MALVGYDPTTGTQSGGVQLGAGGSSRGTGISATAIYDPLAEARRAQRRIERQQRRARERARRERRAERRRNQRNNNLTVGTGNGGTNPIPASTQDYILPESYGAYAPVSSSASAADTVSLDQIAEAGAGLAAADCGCKGQEGCDCDKPKLPIGTLLLALGSFLVFGA